MWRAVYQHSFYTSFPNWLGVDKRVAMLFAATETDAVNQLKDLFWNVENIAEDLDLFKIVLAAESNGCADWLDDKLKEDAASELPWRQDRALLGAALRVMPIVDTVALSIDPLLEIHSKWIKHKTAVIAARANWQYFWLERYYTVCSDEEAYSALVLFIEVADTRWTLIREKIESKGLVLSDKKEQYLRIRQSDIEKSVKEFKKELKGKFLFKDINRGVWPW